MLIESRCLDREAPLSVADYADADAPDVHDVGGHLVKGPAIDAQPEPRLRDRPPALAKHAVQPSVFGVSGQARPEPRLDGGGVQSGLVLAGKAALEEGRPEHRFERRL